jgi:hypothetical protein
MNFKAQPAQIRTSASTHTALMKDEWRKSGLEDRGLPSNSSDAAGLPVLCSGSFAVQRTN